MEENELNELKFKLEKLKDKVESIENEMDNFKFDLNKEFNQMVMKAQTELDNRATQIFTDGLFLESSKKFFIKLIEDEIRVSIKNASLHEYLHSITAQYVKDKVKPITEIVVEKIVKDLNRKFRKDYEVTKELCYSIDSEMRHTMKRLPISVISENLFKDKLSKIFERNGNVIENKMRD